MDNKETKETKSFAQQAILEMAEKKSNEIQFQDHQYDDYSDHLDYSESF